MCLTGGERGFISPLLTQGLLLIADIESQAVSKKLKNMMLKSKMLSWGLL